MISFDFLTISKYVKCACSGQKCASLVSFCWCCYYCVMWPIYSQYTVTWYCLKEVSFACWQVLVHCLGRITLADNWVCSHPWRTTRYSTTLWFVYFFIQQQKHAIFGGHVRWSLVDKVMKFDGGGTKTEWVKSVYMTVWVVSHPRRPRSNYRSVARRRGYAISFVRSTELL